MKLFIDTAEVEHIKKAARMGIICGVTTNPTLIARSGRDFKEVVTEICGIVDGPISAEVISLQADGMVSEARELVKIHKNIVIKIPLTADGLEAASVLSKEGIKTNVTLVFSAAQALLAARAGATYVSPFVNRLDVLSESGIGLIEEIAHIFAVHGIETEIISASIKNARQVVESAAAGADVATVPFDVLMQMVEHPMTDKGIEIFLKDWESVPK